MTNKPLDTGKVLHGLAVGKSQEAIAKDCGVHQTTVGRFLAKIRPHFADLQQFSHHRGDVLSYLHTQSLSLQEKALMLLHQEMDKEVERRQDKAVKPMLKIHDLLYILRGSGMNQANLYDRMRLESGLSTQNVGLAGIVEHFHENVGFFDQETGKVKASILKAKPVALKQPAHNVTSSQDNQ